jgi:hypothetical protein
MAQIIDLVGASFCFSLFFLLLDLLVARRILVIGGDWVAHPSNIAARRILVKYPLLAVVSGEGSPEPPSIRMYKLMESLLQLFHHTEASFCFPLLLYEKGFFKGYVSTLSVSFSCVHLEDEEAVRIWMDHISLFFLVR